MKKILKKVGLYDPYLDVLGGGEKYLLSILKVFEEMGYAINIFWDKDLSREIDQRFSVCFKKISWLPNLFKKKGNWIKKLVNLAKLDIFIYVSDGSFFFSLAKKNFIYLMIPDKKNYSFDLFNKVKLFNWQFFTHSFFNNINFLKWGIKSDILYPYIDDNYFKLNIRDNLKEKIILSVGRFFPHLHTKQHKLIIEYFKKLKNINPEFKDFKLILVGGLKEEDKVYFKEIQSLIKNDHSIILKPNVSFNVLYDLYKRSTFYWHFTGFGINDKTQPELVEHLGIAILEAMAMGNVVFSYRAGGPKELIKDGENGYLFSNEDELMSKMKRVINDKNYYFDLIANAQKYVKMNFNYSVFKNKVKDIFIRNRDKN